MGVALPRRMMSRESRRRHSAHRLAGSRLLLIDDHPDALEALATVLELEGARVEVESTASAALAYLAGLLAQPAPAAQRALPTAVLCDLEMPGLDGYGLLERLRALEAAHRLRPALPVLAVTAHVEPHERRRALAAGFAGHVGKPVDLPALIDWLAVHATGP